MKITVPLSFYNKEYARDVEGEIVDIAPHLGGLATFIVHKNPYNTRYWQITNVESGNRIGSSYQETRKIAVDEARAYLRKKSGSDVLAAYKEWRVK